MRSASSRLDAIVFGTEVDFIDTLKLSNSRLSIRSTVSTAAVTSASTGFEYSSSRRCLGSEPELTPTRSGVRCSRASAITSATFSGPPMLPGFRRTQCAPTATARGTLARIASPLAARARTRRHERLFALTRLPPGARVLDVGCGSIGLRALEPELDITGVDIVDVPDYPGPFVRADATVGLPF